MFKLSLYLLSNVIAYALALHQFLPMNDAPATAAAAAAKKTIYTTNFVPPSAERFFAAAAAEAVPPSTKAAVSAPPLPPAANAPYLGPYSAYQAQYPSFPYKQYQAPYYPGVFYPPAQQFVYPGAVGPSPVVYVPRYPVPAESGNEQGGSSGGAGGWGNYFPSNWQSWGSNWGSYFPSWPGSGGSESAEGGTPSTSAEGSSSQTGASSASSSNRGKPEKVEATEPTPAPAFASSQDSVKLDGNEDKNAVVTAAVQLPEQQYVLLGQPQFFGQLAAFPADRDPTTLNGAAKGAVSSFLLYKDQSQQVVPQRFDDISSVPGSASLAYQRFLLLSKQRSEDGPKLTNKSESFSSTPTLSSPSSTTNIRNELSSQPGSNSTSPAAADEANIASHSQSQTSPAKTSEDGGGGGGGGAEIAQVTPNAVAYAGIGGVAGAAPVGTAFIANSGLASSAPRATAIAGTSQQSPDFAVDVVPAKTISIARYTPQRKYHVDTVALSARPLYSNERRISPQTHQQAALCNFSIVL